MRLRRADVDEGAAGRRATRCWPASRPRSPTHPAARRPGPGRPGPRRVERRPARPRGRPARAPQPRVAARAWPASSTGCWRCSSRGATSTDWDAHRGRRGAGPPLHRDRPAASPRRCATGSSTGSTRPRPRRSCRASPTSGAAPTATIRRRRRCAGRPAASPTGPAGVEALWRTLAAAEDDAGLPETRPPDPGFTAVRARVGGGGVPRRHPRRRGDDRRRLRPQRQAGDRPAAPGRRGRPATPRPATAARAAADACFRGVVAAASAGAVIRPGEPWGTPATGAPDVDGAGGRHRPGPRSSPRTPAPGWASTRPTAATSPARSGSPRPRRRRPSEVPLDALDLADRRPGRATWSCSARPPTGSRAWHRRRPVTVTVDGRVRFDGRGHHRRRRQRPVPARRRPRPPRPPRRRATRGAGLRGPARPARAELRRRVPGGGHLPHPQIATATGRVIDVRWRRPAPLEIDGRPGPPAEHLEVRVVPGAFRLLV